MGAYVSMCETGCCGSAFSRYVTYYKDTVNAHKLKQLQIQKTKNTRNWRQKLEEKISTIPETTQYWPSFKETILEHINSSKDDDNVEWIIDVKLINSYCPYHPYEYPHCTFPEDGEKFVVFERAENKFPISPIENHLQRTLTATQIEETFMNERHTIRSQRIFRSNGIKIRKAQAWVENAAKRSGKDELKRILKTQLKTKNHVVNQLIKVFHNKFDEVFEKDFSLSENKEFSKVEEELLSHICELLKSFIKVLRKFLMWLYRELVKGFMKILKEEDLRPEYIMEFISYGSLFANDKSNLNKLIKNLVKKQCSAELKKLEEKFSKKRTLSLQEYDLYLEKSSLFLMNNNPYAYENIVTKISDLQYQQNPYKKFETILSLESQMLKELESYYQTKQESLFELKTNFGLDVKVPILIYCIIKSQNLNIVIDRILIDKFVNQDFLGKVQNYTTFAGCLEFFLQDEEFDKKHGEKTSIQTLNSDKKDLELTMKS